MWLIIGVACALAGLAYILVAPLPGEESSGPSSSATPTTTTEEKTPERGIIDYKLEQSSVDLSAVSGLVAEMGASKLAASWTRILVHWAALQPTSPNKTSNDSRYSAAYVKQLDTIINALHAEGIKVIVSMVDVPKWASDRALWDDPEPGFAKGEYQSFYAPDMGDPQVSAAFKGVGEFLASRYAGKVNHFECWNEPNQGSYLYPQTPESSTNGGAATYLVMLQQWYAGVKAGNESAVVIAGATAPRGRGDETSTPPQAFAKYLQTHGAAAYMDAYSHHPYTPGGSRDVAPGDPPNNTVRCVTLGNLNQLTELFPDVPFYLTEYGYNTQYSVWFGTTVTRAEQARYLRQAYAYTRAHYRQVKALLWFLVDDWNPSGKANDETGVYMGVCTTTGQRKPSWYAFAGGNRVTLTGPSSVQAGEAFSVSGKLTVARDSSAAKGAALTIQVRKSAGGGWTKAATATTRADGSYACTLKQRATKAYRVIWGGVCESASLTVQVQ